MSKDSKAQAEYVRRNLQSAEPYLKAAQEHAGKTGDQVLVKQVDQVSIQTTKIKTELNEKLGPHNG